MTSQEIIEGNKLIGWFDEKYKSANPITKGTMTDAIWNQYLSEKGWYEYHTSWDWLMPVWYKFRDLKFISPKLQFEHSEYKDSISRVICYQDIQVAFNEMVIAIKWHNQNQ